jgi:hypothetical protein
MHSVVARVSDSDWRVVARPRSAQDASRRLDDDDESADLVARYRSGELSTRPRAPTGDFMQGYPRHQKQSFWQGL